MDNEERNQEMNGMDYYLQSEVAYRTERVRKDWTKARRGRRTTRRWQGPLRGADEMR